MIFNNDADKMMQKIRREHKLCFIIDILDTIVFIAVAIWVYNIRGCHWDAVFIILAVAIFGAMTFCVFRREAKIRQELKWYDEFDQKQRE